MAITIKKDKATAVTATNAAPSNPLAYLSAEAQEAVAQLPAEVQAQFAAVSELTPELIEAVAESIPETLMEQLITDLENVMEAQAPSVEVTPAKEVTAQPAVTDKAAEAKAKRDALKAEIAANAKTPVTVTQKPEPAALPVEVQDAAPTQPAALQIWDQLFPVNQVVTIVNRGNGKFEMQIGKVLPTNTKAEKVEATTAGKPKKVKVSVISGNPDYWTDEYKAFQKDMKENYTDLESRTKLAESLGLVKGTDWNDKTKDGQPMPLAIENMQLMNAIREKKGIEIYIESARTPEQRRALAHSVTA